MSDRPTWRAVYDRIADEISPRLTEVTASDGFAEVVEAAGQIGARAATELERSSRRFLHACNLPAGSDIAVLRQEIGALGREVRALSRLVEELQRELAATRSEAKPMARVAPSAPSATAPKRRKAS